jgi:outer membrane protein OmpA-like peptidoglycan-associated protein
MVVIATAHPLPKCCEVSTGLGEARTSDEGIAVCSRCPHQEIMMHRSLSLVTALATVVSASGCTSATSYQTKGAVTGATAGGTVGALAGTPPARPRRAWRLARLVGGAGGAIIGHQMDQQAKEIHQNIPAAGVARVGEGMDVTFASALLFSENSAELTEQARRDLTPLAQSLQKYPNTNVLIVGHTDSTGAESENMALSERRAAATAHFLESQGVSRSRIRAQGRGASEPVAPSDTEADRQRNRRVEVAIYASDAFKTQAGKGQ